MNMLLRPPSLTPEEFEELSGMEGYELVDGRPREKSMGFETSVVQSRIGRLLGAVVDANQLGWVGDSEAGYACFPHRPGLVRKPDVSFVRRGHFPANRPPSGYPKFAPDLAVEVVSPNDTVYELDEKLWDYRQAAVPVVWVVIPNVRWVEVRTAADPKVIRLFREDDELTGDPVIPGFRVRVADLFPFPLDDSDDTTEPSTPAQP